VQNWEFRICRILCHLFKGIFIAVITGINAGYNFGHDLNWNLALNKAWFRRRFTHVPNLIDELSPLKDRRLNQFGTATLLSWTRSAALFDTGAATDSYGALAMCRTKCINYDNVQSSHDALLQPTVWRSKSFRIRLSIKLKVFLEILKVFLNGSFVYVFYTMSHQPYRRWTAKAKSKSPVKDNRRIICLLCSATYICKLSENILLRCNPMK